eukprot:15472923-Alexandrium_andersonii.AAC.1
MEEERASDKMLWEAYVGYKEARGILNQVRRGRGFWPIVAISCDDMPSSRPPRQPSPSSAKGEPKGKSKGSGSR